MFQRKLFPTTSILISSPSTRGIDYFQGTEPYFFSPFVLEKFSKSWGSEQRIFEASRILEISYSLPLIT